MRVKDYLGKIVVSKETRYVGVITGVPKTKGNMTPDTVVMVEFPCEIPGYTHRCIYTFNDTEYLIDRIKNIQPLDRQEIYRYFPLRKLVILKN